MWSARARCLAPAAAGALVGLSNFDRCRLKGLARCHEVSFSPDEYREFPVLEVRQVAPATNVLKCGLPSSQHIMGMPVTSYVMVGGKQSGDASPFTPITTDDQAGYFELMVKAYPNGNVSKYLCTLKVGDSVRVRGPIPKLPYTANMKKHIGMIAGGSGVTPMLQIIKEILKNPADKTDVTLVCGHHTPADILLHEEIDALVASSKGQLKVFYAVDRKTGGSSRKNIAHTGHFTEEFLGSVLPRPSPDTKIYICGPPKMVKAVAGGRYFVMGDPWAQGHIWGMLKDLGYSLDMVFKF